MLKFAPERGSEKAPHKLDMAETLETIIFLAPIALGIIGGIIWDIITDKKQTYKHNL